MRSAAAAAGADSEALTSLAVTVAAAIPDLVAAKNDPIDISPTGRR